MIYKSSIQLCLYAILNARKDRFQLAIIYFQRSCYIKYTKDAKLVNCSRSRRTVNEDQILLTHLAGVPAAYIYSCSTILPIFINLEHSKGVLLIKYIAVKYFYSKATYVQSQQSYNYCIKRIVTYLYQYKMLHIL